MTFGEKIKQLREENYLSQRDVAERIHISIGSYGAYESGKRKPLRNPEVYDKLADLFGCSKEYLMNDEMDEMPGYASAPSAQESAPSAKKAKGTPATEADSALRKKKSATVYMELQYNGRSISLDDISENARKLAGNTGHISVYVKPEEGKAYYVSENNTGAFEI